MSKLTAFAAGALLAGNVTAALPAHASKYSVVYSFQGENDGAEPLSGMIAVDGTLYGTTYFGGAANVGTVYAVTPGGIETTLHTFQGGADGATPWGGLLNVSGILYGTTYGGGDTNGDGTVFSMTLDGAKTVLHTFTRGTDGASPVGSLVKSGNTLYGTTAAGGNGIDCGGPTAGCGTVFKINHNDAYSQIHRFNLQDADQPLGTMLPFNGELYGTSYNGGEDINNSLGTLYKVTKDGAETVLHSFGAGVDGADPVGGLINVDGTFYGTTESGGAHEFGTVFSVTPAGVETVLHDFTSMDNDGGGPQVALIYVNGMLYGVTGGGYNQNGSFHSTLFSITPAGVLKTLHTFGKGTDGDGAVGNLTYMGHTLYGTTAGGGTSGKGTVFKYKL